MKYTHPEIISYGERIATVIARDEEGLTVLVSGDELFIGDEHATAYQHADFFMQRWLEGSLP